MDALLQVFGVSEGERPPERARDRGRVQPEHGEEHRISRDIVTQAVQVTHRGVTVRCNQKIFFFKKIDFFFFSKKLNFFFFKKIEFFFFSK